MLVIVLTCVSIISELLIPNRNELPFNPTTKAEGFYAQEKDSLDMVFVGSSNLFSTICPAVLWEEQGITSYVYGANEQNWELSYYYVKELLKYQQPEIIVLDAYYCAFDEHQRIPVIRINLDDMRWGINKFSAIFNVTSPKEWFGFIWPIEEYHDRWKDIASETATPDVYYSFKGWSPIGKHTDFPEEGKQWSDGIEYIADSPYDAVDETELPEQTLEWLDDINELCRSNDVELIVLLTPNSNKICLPVNGGEEYEQTDGSGYYKSLEKAAADRNITFINLNASMEGLYHNETTISCRATSLFGRWLSENRSIQDKRGQVGYDEWDECVDEVYAFLKE